MLCPSSATSWLDNNNNNNKPTRPPLSLRRRNCWVDKTYSQRGACKRYLYKGFYGEHLAIWASLYPPEQIAVLRSERSEDAAASPASPRVASASRPLRRIFDASTKTAALENLFAFLGYGATKKVVAPDKACWHDCDKKKRAQSADVPPNLAHQLDALYAPSNKRLDAMLASGKVTAL